MARDVCTCGLQSNGYVTRSATLCDACKAEAVMVSGAASVITRKVVEAILGPIAEQMKAGYIAYLEAKLAAAKRGDWEEVARLKRNLHGHYGKFASGGVVKAQEHFVAGSFGARDMGYNREAVLPLNRNCMYGKSAHDIIADDVTVWGTGHEQIIQTHNALDHIAAERAAMVVKPPVDPDDEIYGQAARGDDGQLLPKQRANAPRLPGLRIADDGEVIRDGLKKLEAERSAILNRPDPDLAPRCNPPVKYDGMGRPISELRVRIVGGVIVPPDMDCKP